MKSFVIGKLSIKTLRQKILFPKLIQNFSNGKYKNTTNFYENQIKIKNRNDFFTDNNKTKDIYSTISSNDYKKRISEMVDSFLNAPKYVNINFLLEISSEYCNSKYFHSVVLPNVIKERTVKALITNKNINDFIGVVKNSSAAVEYLEKRLIQNLTYPPNSEKLRHKEIAINKSLEKMDKEDYRIYLFFKSFIDLLIYHLSSKYKSEIEALQYANQLITVQDAHLWYPLARKLKRKIFYHYGPTNSGKTYTAIKSLINSKNGMYCAPLRLLAWEIHEKLNDKNVICDLLTGQERVNKHNSTHVSCTIEKSIVNKKFDVVVIDEIQMIKDEFRGDSWTTAVLGTAADEIHLCGDGTAINLVKSMLKVTNDTFEAIEYKRLSELSVSENTVSRSFFTKKSNSSSYNENNLLPGDCIIAFSKKDVLKIKNQIEEAYNSLYSKSYRNTEASNLENKNESNTVTSVIYGNLPPKTKKQEALNFNSGKTQFLIATDAIGMGLNLSIKRIIFNSIVKFNGSYRKVLDLSEIKQISGRAGRFNTDGKVTAFDNDNLQYIKEILSEEKNLNLNLDKINYKACLFLNIEAVKEISEEYKRLMGKSSIRFYDVLCFFNTIYTFNEELYFLKDNRKMLEIAKLIKNVKNLSLTEEYYFCLSPIKLNSKEMELYLLSIANHKAKFNKVLIPIEFKLNVDLAFKIHVDKTEKIENNVVNLMNSRFGVNKSWIKDTNYFEFLYNCFEVYIFMGNHVDNCFVEQDSAFMYKDKIGAIIDVLLHEEIKME